MLENICTDLETSKKLKELGFDAKTNFYWVIYLNKETNENETHLEFSDFLNLDHIQGSVYSCKTYTLEQVLNKLPLSFYIREKKFDLIIHKKEGVKYIYQAFFDEPAKDEYIKIRYRKEDNLATSAAKLWIKLKKSEIV